MDPQTPEPSFIDSLKNSAAQFVTLSFSLLIAFAAMRSFEFISYFSAHQMPHDTRNVLAQAVLFDIVSFGELIPFLFLLFFVAFLISKKSEFRYQLYRAAGSSIVIAYALLVIYFKTTLLPLGSDLFGYTWKEIAATIKAGATIDAMSVLIVIVPLVLFRLSLAFSKGRTLFGPAASLVMLAACGVMAWLIPLVPARTLFSSELSYNLAVNKPAYFAKESFAYFTSSGKTTGTAVRSGTGNAPRQRGEFVYVSEEYPFLRKNETEDVLGKFFTIHPTRPPNLVFILVEGLGCAFSGTHAYLGSFTPFLDELAEKSLHWENFLASQGRTFAALPSILASLPFAEHGFSDLKHKMPKHLSLMSILKHDGYRLKFFMGSDPDFDDERLFLRKQGVDELVGIDDFDNSYAKSPGTSWGYPDREVMRKALEVARRDQRQPYLSFVQTMSMHTSYSIPDQEKYVNLFEARMTALGFDETKKARHREFSNIYSTIIYTDDALRFFFDGYRKLPSYENTIFIITGDHRLPEIPMSTKIDRFHVPLIIFSPLLKRSLHIESISSHLDITPSLLAYLGKNYSIKVPELVPWVGSGLDTEPSLRNIHAYPLKHTKTNLIDYISGMYFIDQEVLFAIGKDLDLEPVQNEQKRDELAEGFSRYKSKNDRFARELKLMPESIYEQFHAQ
jgi:phosphoglycerol transferase MdoB-like AlkP superfamily enzyme